MAVPMWNWVVWSPHEIMLAYPEIAFGVSRLLSRQLRAMDKKIKNNDS